MPSPLRQPRIAVFLGAEALSAVGAWATLIAIWGYAAFEFDASATEVSVFGLAFGLPGIVLGPWAGAAVDRFGPKATLAAAKMLGVVAALLLLLADDFVTLGLLSSLHGIAHTFSLPALQAIPPRLVDDEHLASTNALVSLTDEVAIVLGPVVGAGAIALTSFQGAFVVDAITYAIGLAVLPLVSLRPLDVEHDHDAPPPRVLDGWRTIRRTPALRRVVASTALVHALYGAAILVEPLYVRDVLGRSEQFFALLQVFFGIALVVGGILVTRAGERLAHFGVVVVGVAGSGVAAFIYLGTPWLAAATIGVVLWGFLTALMGGPTRTLLQRATPEREHGRVLAADLMAGSMAEVTAVASLGFIIDALGIRTSVGILAAGIVAGAAWLGVTSTRDQSSQAVPRTDEALFDA